MASEQEKMLNGIQFAMQMEEEGKQYYLKASQQCNNKLGKELFTELAKAEAYHQEKFKSVYQAVRQKKGWPDTKMEAISAKKLKTLFTDLSEANACPADEAENQLSAIEKAMTKEMQSRNLYRDMSRKSAYESEKAFYDMLMKEENSHYQALVDYKEFIINPDGYFVAHEHHSLDGG